MSTLWTFGDSMTAGDGCVDNLPIRDGYLKYYNEYKKEGDDIWPVFLSNKLGFNLRNLGLSGASNEKIIDSHFSFNGHKNLSDFFYYQLMNEKTLI